MSDVQFWITAFEQCERLDSLALLFRVWWEDRRDGMTEDQRRRIIAAKDARKKELTRRTQRR